MGETLEYSLTALGHYFIRQWKPWLLGLTILFLWFPSVDLTVSGWFYTPPATPIGGWLLGGTLYGQAVLKGLFPLVLVILLTLVARWYWSRTGRKPAVPWASGAALRYLLASLILGPGLIVNVLLKDHWGRARPLYISQFGGTAHFTPPLIVTDQCQSNCAFSSGHAALGYWLVSVALLAPPAWRGRAVAGALAFGTLIGFTRIAQGAHFLSDVVASGIIVVAVALVLRRRMLADWL